MAGKKEKTVPKEKQIVQSCNPLEQSNHKNIITEKQTVFNPDLDVLSFDKIEIENIKWLFYPYIPFGKVTIIQGDPGEGKTTLVLEIIARLTNGQPIIDGYKAFEPMNIVYQTCEDGLADTIKPRLIKSGADCSRVHTIIDDNVTLTMTDTRIEETISAKNIKLFVLDPIQGFLGTDVDMHRANEIRPVMKRLANLAEKYSCAIILIGHLNKCIQGGKASYRGLGSIDFQASARSVLLVGRLKDNPKIRVLCQTKNSLAEESKGLAFKIGGEKNFEWLGETDVTPDKLLNGASDVKISKKTAAENFLKEFLADGEKPQNEIMKIANERGISERTLRTAKSLLDVKSKKVKDGWVWYL